MRDETRHPKRSPSLTASQRVPIPFSLFPSSYRENTEEETTRTRVEVDSKKGERVGREDRYSSFSASLPGRKDRTRYDEEEIRVSEEDRHRRPARRERDREEITVHEEGDHRHRDDRRTEVEFSRER